MALLGFGLNTFAQEMPAMKDFEEVSRELSLEMHKIQEGTEGYNTSKETSLTKEAEISKRHEDIIKQRNEIAEEYSRNRTNENFDALEAVSRSESAIQAEMISLFSEDIIRDINFIDDVSVNLYRLGNLYEKFNDISAKQGIELQIDHVEMEGAVVDALLMLDQITDNVDMEGFEDMIADELESLNVEFSTGLNTAGSNLKNLGEEFKDYAARLMRVKTVLEKQKKQLAATAFNTYIKDVESRFAMITKGVNGESIVGNTLSGITDRSDKIKTFNDRLNSTSGSSPSALEAKARAKSSLEAAKEKRLQQLKN